MQMPPNGVPDRELDLRVPKHGAQSSATQDEISSSLTIPDPLSSPERSDSPSWTSYELHSRPDCRNNLNVPLATGGFKARKKTAPLSAARGAGPGPVTGRATKPSTCP